jgi:hypothetical protein
MWHESENYIKKEIWVLHSQFTNSHFCLHITVEMTALNGASVSQNQFLHSCYVHIHPWCAELNSAQSSALKCDHFLTLCTIVRHAVLSIHYHHTALSTVSVFKWMKQGLPTRTKSHFIHLQRWTLPTSLSLHINLSH